MKLEFSPQIFEKILVSNFMKMRPVGAELLHADGRQDGQADMTFFFNSFHTVVLMITIS